MANVDVLDVKGVFERVNRPTAEACGLPNEAYTSEAFGVDERDGLLSGSWLAIGFVGDLRSRGAARPVAVLGLPLVVVRDQHDEIAVFHNVCSHRGQQLVGAACQTKGVLRCPYHSWAYGLDGSLRGTPHIGGPGVHEVEGFERNRHGLRRVRTAVWLGIIFVNLSGSALPFEEHMAPVRTRWAQFCGVGGLERLHVAEDDEKLSLEVNANWKLAVENYCESYHLPWVHPGLNSYSRLEDHYNIVGPGNFSGQGSTAYDFASTANVKLPEFEAWPKDRRKHAEYLAVYPNLLLGIQVDHVFAMVLLPVSHTRTHEQVQIYYVSAAATGVETKASRQDLTDGWREVFAEDVGVVEGMQRGRHSPAFEGGVFSPVMDPPTHHFHKWVASNMTAHRG